MSPTIGASGVAPGARVAVGVGGGSGDASEYNPCRRTKAVTVRFKGSIDPPTLTHCPTPAFQ